MIKLLLPATLQTLYMVALSGLFTLLFGLPLGILLTITGEEHLIPRPKFNHLLSSVVNMMRSLPFVILMIFIMPFTRLIVGTSIGTNAAVVPLVVAAIPFFARVVETALKEVDDGVIEASVAMGATNVQIIREVLLKEALPSLILGVAMTLINLIGYSAMAGAVGGGGIGDLAIRYGYHRFRIDIMFATIVLLVLLVQCVQTLGNILANQLIKTRRK